MQFIMNVRVFAAVLNERFPALLNANTTIYTFVQDISGCSLAKNF